MTNLRIRLMPRWAKMAELSFDIAWWCLCGRCVPVLLILSLMASNAYGFAINATSKLVFFKTDISHNDEAIHEQITEEGVRRISPGATARFIYNLQRGVENTDLTHQFDSESHFDNCNPTNSGFKDAWDRINDRIRRAWILAAGNPQFLDPSYKDFFEIARDTADTLAQLAVDPGCLGEPGCPATESLAASAVIGGHLPALVANPSPDPHWPTTELSLFSPSANYSANPPSGMFGDVNKTYLEIIDVVNKSVEEALGGHSVPRVCFPDLLHPNKPQRTYRICDPFTGRFCYTYEGPDLNPLNWTYPEICPGCGCTRTLEQVLGSRNGHVQKLIRLRQAIRAYHAFQELGHAIHAAQDFFAHTDYVELMAARISKVPIAVGDPIAEKTKLLPGDIPVPSRFQDFSREGLVALLGSDINHLESGAVKTIWLGEGDYCLGDAGVENAFNPLTQRTIGGIPSPLPGILPDIPSYTTPLLGHNPLPPPGFRYGHYRTSTQLGLNKDSPKDAEKEPSHANHDYARDAAVRFTAVMWEHFLTFGASDPGGPVVGSMSLDCPYNITVYVLPGESTVAVGYPQPTVRNGHNPTIRFDPPSGSVFPVGRTTVQCTAQDDRGGSASCSFVVSVMRPEPRDRILVKPVTIVQTRGDTLEGYEVEGLIDGNGLREDPTLGNFGEVTHGDTGLWATATSVGGNYFAQNQPPPTFELGLDAVYPLSELVVWGYLGNNNEATDFWVEFSADGGVTWTGPEAVSSPRLLRDGSVALPFGSPHDANKVRLSMVNNGGGRGFQGVGAGDRVGLGEIRFIATPRVEMVVPNGVSQRVGDTLDGYSVSNLITDAGLSGRPSLGSYGAISQGIDGRWVTATDAFPGNYFDLGRPAPVLEFSFDEIYRLTDLIVWGYAGNNNEGTDFKVEFSTDGGATYTRQEIVSSPKLLANSSVRLPFRRGMFANQVRLTFLKNGGNRGFSGIGPGDRVGLGKVRFAGSRLVQRNGPGLVARRDGGRLRLSWPSIRGGMVLETSDRLVGGVWTTVPNASTNEFFVATSSSPQFFRLRNPIPTDALLQLSFDGNTANEGMDGAIGVDARNIFRYVGDRDDRAAKAVDLANANDTRAGGLITTENLDLGTDFTFSFWMKHDGNFNNPANILGQGNWFAFYLLNERVRFGPVFQLSPTDSGLDPVVPSQLDRGVWHHYVGIVRRTGAGSSEARLYFDGELAGVRTFDSALMSPTDCRFFMGSTPEGDEYCQGSQPAENGRFNGALDDVRVFVRAISDAEVLALARERSTAPPPKNPVPPDASLYLALDQNTANSGTDASLQPTARNGREYVGDRRGRDKAALNLYNGGEAGLGGIISTANPRLGSEFTISVWLKSEQSNDANVIGVGNWFTLYQNAGRMRFGLVNSETPESPNLDSQESAAFPLGFWRHYAAVLAKTGPDQYTARLYVNGSMVGSRTYSSIPSYPGSCYLQLGSRPQGSSYCNEQSPDESGGNFPGSVDDVRVFRRALTDAEIKALADE